MEEQTQQLVSKITDYVNSFSNKAELFNTAMSNEHRTLQQSFTKLCLSWLEHVASPDYKFDDRNEDSVAVAETLMKLFRERQEGLGFKGVTLDMMAKPSKHLPLI